jgi:hypothetical protein
MLTEKEILDARKLLQDAVNPLYLFDDDTDGLSSFLVLRKKFGRGVGIPIKTSPELDAVYASKVDEIQPDLVVILDKPLVAKEFFDKVNVPVMWVDHHPVTAVKNVHYFNPRVHDNNDARPTTYQCYLISGEESWESLIGCLGDWYLPDFYGDFLKKYPDLLKPAKDAGEIIYETKFGQLTRIFMFLLKGKSDEIRKNISTLLKIQTPWETLDSATPQGKYLMKKIEKPMKEYKELLSNAVKEATDENLLVFIYPGSKNSYTGELANELFYQFPKKLIIVGREKNSEIKMSLRSNNLKLPLIIEKALVGVKGYGGGHDQASGGCVSQNDFERFIKNIKDEMADKL